MAVLRYYLAYDNDEDFARGLLILFFPFRNEIEEIHSKDVKLVLSENCEKIEEKRAIFEKYKLMSDLISAMQTEVVSADQGIDEKEEDENCEIETTELTDIEQFNKWAKSQATKDLSKFKNLTKFCSIEELITNISPLNYQQRHLFDDMMERFGSHDVNEKPVYLFLSGNAGTGKSFLLKVLIEAVKFMKIKPGDEIKKPPVLVMAPTANAAFIIGGKTIDSALGFLPGDGNNYTQAKPGKLAMMQHQFEDLSLLVTDEISMVGARKLLKMNFRLQDVFCGERKKQYMAGISFLASGTRISKDFLSFLQQFLETNKTYINFFRRSLAVTPNF